MNAVSTQQDQHSDADTRPAPAPAPAPAISVVIPTNRSAHRLAGALDALGGQTLAVPDGFEVIVVLDGSAAGPRETLVARSYPFPLTIVRSPARGRAAACNAGVAVARGDVILLLDDDMALRPDGLAAHLRRHRAGPSALGVIGNAPIAFTRQSPFAARYVGRRFRDHLRKLAQPGYELTMRDVYTGAFSIERAVFRAAGGFDDRFDEYGNEDGELAGRLRAAGVELVFAPEALAHQSYDKSFAALADDHASKGRTAVRFVRMHPDRRSESSLVRARRGSPGRRLIRAALSRLVVPPARRRAVLSATERVAAWLDLVRPRQADRLAAMVLDGCFWAGVREAGRGRPREAGRGRPREPDRRRSVVHYTDATTFGGAERVILTLLTGLDGTRWRPVLVGHAGPGLDPLLSQARAAGIAVIELPPRRGPAGILSIPALARTFRRLRPAVVHVHRSWAPSGNLAVVAAALAGGSRLVATEHLYLPTTSRRVLWLRRLLDRLVERTIAVSASVGDDVRREIRTDPGRLRVIRNGIAAPAPPAPAEVADLRRRLLAGRTGSIALVPAQLRRQKGHAILLAALPRLPDVVAVFAGDGPERAALGERAQSLGVANRVRFLGERSDLPALMVAADVIVLPSIAEGLPLAALEGAALGRPVVASRVGGLPEIVEDGRTGRLVPPGDSPALAQALAALLEDRQAAAGMGVEARRRFERGFTAERMVAEVAASYDEILATAARRTPGREAAGVRALDWRFLLGRDRFGAVVRFGPPVDGLASIADCLIQAADAVERSAELAIARDSDDRTIARIRAVLAPDGVAVVRTRRPASMVRRLRRAGFSDPRAFGSWPTSATPRALLPLDDVAAQGRFFSAPGSRGRAVARQAKRRLWDLRLRLGLLDGYVVAGSGVEGITPEIQAAWTRAHGDRAPDRLTWTLLTGGRESISKVVAIANRPGHADQGIVVKWPRTREAGDRLAQEADMLEAVAGLPGWVPQRGPALLGRRPTAVGPALVESLLPGVPLLRILSREQHQPIAFAAADWLADLAADAPIVPRADWWARAAGPVVDRFEALVAGTIPAGTLRAARECLHELGDLPLVVEHRDLAPWNVLVDRAGAIHVVDWESAVPSGLPVLDLWYFLTYLALGVEHVPERGLARAYPRLVDPSTPSGRIAAAALDRYGRRLGLDATVTRDLRALTWAVHVPSEVRRQRAGIDGATGTFVRLWQHELDNRSLHRATSRRPCAGSPPFDR